MDPDRSLRESLLESVDDMDSITKQMLDSLLNRDKYQRGGESLTQLVQLFEEKQNDIKKHLYRVPEFRERENLIRSLEECVNNRNEVIENLEANLKVAETALTSAVFQANNKLRSVRLSEIHPIDSEETIKLAHQISKNYSVAAPLFWQQGDPSRPFPTEPEFRASAMAAPRPTLPTTSINLLRQSGPTTMRTPPMVGNRGVSPMTTALSTQQKPWSGSSPRVGYQPPSSSPRGRGGMAWTGRGGAEASPFNRRSAQNSPRLVSPSVTLTGVGAPRLAQPVKTVEQMSSDSSSSSSSDDESPK